MKSGNNINYYDYSVTPRDMGSVNGLAQSIVALTRMFAPSIYIYIILHIIFTLLQLLEAIYWLGAFMSTNILYLQVDSFSMF